MLLAIIVINIVLPFGMYAGDREDAAEWGAMEGVSLALTTGALAALYVPFLAGYGLKRSQGALHVSGVVPLAVFVGFLAFSVAVAADAQLAFFEVCLYLELLLLYVYLVVTITSEEDVLFLVRMLVFATALESVWIVALSQGVGEFSMLGVKTRVDQVGVINITRIGGTVGSPNDVATLVAMGCIVAASMTLTAQSRFYRLMALATLPVGAVALLLTYSRGGTIGFLAGAAIVAFAAWRWRMLSWKVLATAAAGAVFICGLYADTLATRLHDENGAAQSRLPLMRLAWNIIADHPITGVGANNFGVAMEPYIAPDFTGEFLYAVHNRYMLLWAEAGMGGLAAYLAFLFMALRRGVRVWRTNDAVLSPIAVGCAAAIAGNMLHMLVDVFRGRVVAQMLIILAALIAITEQLVAQKLAAQKQNSVPMQARGTEWTPPARPVRLT